MPEDGVVQEGIALAFHLLAGENMHHGGQGLSGRLPEAVSGPCGTFIGRRHCLLQGHQGSLGAAQPLGFEGADNEQERQGHRCGLCKDEPEPAHRRTHES